MSKFFLTSPIKVPLGQDVLDIKDRLAGLLKIKPSAILSLQLHKQSIDARDKSDVHFVCSYIVECKHIITQNATPYLCPSDLLTQEGKLCGKSCVVVGGGPSGLFVARYLSQMGIKVTVIEQGSDVEARQAKVQSFFDGGSLDEHCNVQFGLGGAGTFSDGKLTTGISSPLVYTVFQEFVRNGAPTQILTDSLPHIGTDNLVKLVANMKTLVEKKGGEFLFDTCVTDFVLQKDKIVGVVAENNGKSRQIFADCVALCCGHSARSLFERLIAAGVRLQPKPFAVGLRVEHTREFVNTVQYGPMFATHRDLGAATYKLTHNIDGRGCYSFCMCPGGFVVPACSEKDTVVVNGMSNFDRSAPNSNSALVVSVSPEHLNSYGFDGVLCGMDFQQQLEKQAYQMGGGRFVAPCQNVTDFLNNRVSADFSVAPSYFRGVKPANLTELFPADIVEMLQQSLMVFDRKMKGFAHCGVLTGVESRTSSPVKILRDENFLSNIDGLFPVGEGAGHAGGIVSAAVDGLKVAQSILKYLA